MQKTVIITGGGTGLGQALALQFAERDFKVFIIGRRAEKLIQTRAISAENINIICADVSSVQGRNKIYQKLLNGKIDYLIHNAAIVTPILPIEKLALKSFQETMAINLEAPLFLTKILLPLLEPNARILHISSDCARYPLANWIPYCISKAGLYMLYECLKKEFKNSATHSKMLIGSIDPGMMDTPMQEYICRPEIQFPEKYTKEELNAQKLILSPAVSAKMCLKLLLEFSDKKFSQKEWRVDELLKKRMYFG